VTTILLFFLVLCALVSFGLSSLMSRLFRLRRRMTPIPFFFVTVCASAYWLCSTFWTASETCYLYESEDGDFRDVECPSKDRTFDYVVWRYDDRTGKRGTEGLMILSQRRWDVPWLWLGNLTHPRWRLPQKSRSD